MMKRSIGGAVAAGFICLATSAYAVPITPSPTIVSGNETFNNFSCNVVGGIGGLTCAQVDVSYVQGPKLSMARSRSHAFQIVPIVVVGANVPGGYRPIKPAIFFTVVEVKEFAV